MFQLLRQAQRHHFLRWSLPHALARTLDLAKDIGRGRDRGDEQ